MRHSTGITAHNLYGIADLSNSPSKAFEYRMILLLEATVEDGVWCAYHFRLFQLLAAHACGVDVVMESSGETKTASCSSPTDC